MIPSGTYTITETLSHGGKAILYRAVRNEDRRPVVLKVLDPRHWRPLDTERLKHEYEIGKQLDTPAAVKPLALETHHGAPTLVLEDFGGQSLGQVLGAPMAVEPFLAIAIAIATAIANIHQQGVVHKDLKPDNIVIDVATGDVKIAGFGLASRLPRERRPAQPARLIEGSLPYLSPEQTGRTNRAIDSRADLYSLGVTFHQMLTGRLPFEAKDPVEWVHCHVARAPPSPSDVVPEVPQAIARIVLRLLSKMPEDRYQSARGLRLDLERCLAELRASGKIEPFALGEGDVTSRLQIPERLYGRGAEIALLREAFGRVSATGTPELLLVSGYSGIGKSALVHELEAPVVQGQGLFLSGKFDPHRRDIPYVTLVQAFREAVLGILAESEAQISAWQQRLVGALGINGRLIVDVIPPVELVIGRQPPVPELPPAEAQNRFRMVLRRFIGVFAREAHPLALFLDDLQWADSASLSLLEELVAHAEVRHLLVIGAYRDNEVSPSHPLMLTLDEVRRAGARVSNIVLGPIPTESLAALVSDTLRCRREDAEPLAELIHERTAGNPFFAIQFLLSLHEDGLIELDEQRGAFQWSVEKIRKKGFTDNVVDLMIGKLARLPTATQEALRHFACLGSTADVALLAMVHGVPEQEAHAALWEAVRAGLVLRLDGAYKFSHDRIQEAAYSRIPEAERAAAHLRIGRLLASSAAPDAHREKIFEIVNQLDRGAALIASREERERTAELNLMAGNRAQRSTAYASALTYFAAGSALMPEDRWAARHDLAFTIELHRAECEYLTGALEAAEERLSMLSRVARNLLDEAAIACVRLSLYTTLDRSDRAIEACLEYLRHVGVVWSPHPSENEVRQEYERLWQKLGSRPIESLVDLPPVTDPVSCATMDVLTRSQSPALFTDDNLHCLLVGRMANLSLEHGNSDGSCLAYVRLGMLLGPRFGDYRTGFRFGKLGLDLVDKRGLLRFKARVYLDFGHLVNPWTRHISEGIGLLRCAFDVAQEMGDLLYASYTCNCSITLLLAAGAPLDEVQREAERGLEFARKARFGMVADIILGQLQLMRALRGLTPDFSSFDDENFDEGQFEQHLAGDPRISIAACWYWIRKLTGRYLAGDYAAAVEIAPKAERLLWTSPSFFEVAEYHFFGALARAAHLGTAPAGERAKHLAALTAHHEQIEVWAASCPKNFENRAALVGAEMARIGGDAEGAAHLYQRAIQSAHDHGFVQNEAIAYEAAARFYRARGFDLIADAHLREARDRYARWGADGKVRQIDRQSPQLTPPSRLAQTATFALQPEQLDLYSVTRASQTISGEIVLDKLLSTLLDVVLTQGGAQRACLLLCRDEGLFIEAEASLDERGAVTSLLGSVPADTSERVPASLLHYVQRTRERVILAAAGAALGKLAGDDYFARHRPQSVLCVPIVQQTEVIALLYLENDLLAGAFTSERLAALELLATQAAISLQNALLLAKERAARAAAEDAERRAAFLADAAALLSESLDYEETLTRLGRLYVCSLADWCSIDVMEDREIRHVAHAHADPEKEPLLEELERRYPPRLDSRDPSATVLRTAQAILAPELPDDVLLATCDDDAHRRLLRELGTRTRLTVPLVARGQTFGAITLGSAAPGRRYGRADLELAQEVAHRAATAIDNARLYRASQEAVRVRNEFLTVASHELNTPITSLMLAIQSLRRTLAPSRPIDLQTVGRMLDLLARQGARLTRLSDDLLDVSRIEAGPLPLELTDVDLRALVREVLDRFEADLSRARCSVSIQGGAPVVGRWDRSRMDRVVDNLVSNAIKFGAGKPIEIFVGVEHGLALLVVRDHGIGVDPDERDRIFGRFERAVSESHYGGLGLGLYVTRRIVEAHGGSIRCDSRAGEGAAFIVELPCSSAQHRLGHRSVGI